MSIQDLDLTRFLGIVQVAVVPKVTGEMRYGMQSTNLRNTGFNGHILMEVSVTLLILSIALPLPAIRLLDTYVLRTQVPALPILLARQLVLETLKQTYGKMKLFAQQTN